MKNELADKNEFHNDSKQNTESIKMLSSLNATNNEKISNTDLKSSSPSSSPRSSPRPSPRPQTRQEHNKSEFLSTSYINKDQQQSFKHEGSPSSQESSTSRVSSISNPEQVYQSDIKSDTISLKDKKDNRSKKKSSWFNSLNPTYKSRSEDFKKLFGEVPTDERLVVDYSCALQKEILVQGRLYVTQNFLCFYANIFGWETNLTVKWKDVAAITKEKTALVIPNAVLICTKAEKYFFTSMVQRDKTYLMLFRIWQNALMDQPMTTQQMWQCVHQCYGSELGLTSDDEDYISPNNLEDEKICSRLSVDSFSEVESITPALDNVMEQVLIEEKMGDTVRYCSTPAAGSDHSAPPSVENFDRSDSDDDKPLTMKDDLDTTECTAAHDGRVLVMEEYPIHIDQLFTLLFTSSKFFLDFHASRKTTDLTQTPWTHNPIDNSKSRTVNLTLTLGQTVGPKTCQVTEKHAMLPCSKAGSLYAVDVESVNAGIPYADSFYVVVHYCLKKVSETHSSVFVTAHIKYKKNVWGFVKGMIERNVWSGLEDFFSKLKEALQTEGEENIPEQRRKSRRKRRLHNLPKYSLEDIRLNIPRKKMSHTGGIFTTDVCTAIIFGVLLLLLIINVMLYLKLWSLEEVSPSSFFDPRVLQNPPKSHDDWIKLLQQQENLHSVEAQKWQRILRNAVSLLRQAEESLNELQRSIQPNYLSKMSEMQEDNNLSNENPKSEL